MSFRDDAVGMFWETLARERAKPNKIPLALPETPDTGWRPPKEFPNLAAAKRIAVDVETKDLQLDELGPGVRRDGHIVGLAIGTDDGGRWYFPMRHEVGAEYNMDPEHVLAWARSTLSDERPKVGANLLYDADYLAQEGVVLGGEWYDVQIAEPLLDENRFTYSLDSLAKTHLGETKVKSALAEWVMQAYRNKKYAEDIWRSSPLLVGPYAEGDVDLPLRILDKQLPLLSDEGLTDLYAIERGILPMLLAMRRFGVRIDAARQQALDAELTQAIDAAQGTLNTLARFRVNVNARTDLERMFRAADVPFPMAEGKVSFSKATLERHTFAGAQAVLDVRKLMKYRDTFVRSYMAHRVGDRIHASFHPLKSDEHGAVSGRFACSDPNLQNIPIRDEVWGPRIRTMFIPEDGMEWYRHDWSQIEYRFLVHFGVGPSAREAQRQYNTNPDTDFHKFVMNMTGLDRKPAKNVNFGLVYGMGVPLLAHTLGMSIEEATRNVFNVYHDKVPFVKATYERASLLAQTRGYVLTFLKRRAHFNLWQPPQARGDDPETRGLPKEAAVAKYGTGVRRAYTHKALNRVLQGSSADLMKKAMLEMWRSGVYNVIPVPHLTVHDELGHSANRSRPHQRAIAEVKRIMENAVKLRVPIIADQERGPTWGECK